MINGFELDLIIYFGEENDSHDSLWWRYYDDRVHWLVNCNDVFYWGCADCEEITEENLSLLKQSVKDARELCDDEVYKIVHGFEEGLMLWVSRIRKERPQGCCYPKNRALWPLFDACGPERETGLGNPYKPGEREEKLQKQKEQNDKTEGQEEESAR